jgi:salicylate hydroxylase
LRGPPAYLAVEWHYPQHGQKFSPTTYINDCTGKYVHYPIPGGKFVNLVAFAPAGDYTVESWTATATMEEFLAEFDGWDPRLTVLARCLAAALRSHPADPDAATRALRRYAELRISRTTRLQEVSHARALVNHLPDGPDQEARDASFAQADPLIANGWIYSYDPESIAVS